MSEPQAEYITDALEMMGAGYDQPAIEIEQERTVIQRRNGKLESIDKPAFIKLSTAFKQELPDISGDALKVWVFIALSINRKTGTANPGLRTIAEGVRLAVNTVQKCLIELEELKLLSVDRNSRKYNIYEAPEYVSANRTDPVSNGDTDGETVSNLPETVSNSAQTVSPSVILNQSNQKEPDKAKFKKTTKQDIMNISIEAAIFGGGKPSQEVINRERIEREAVNAFESAFGITRPWDWWVSDKDWRDLRELVVREYNTDGEVFKRYVAWYDDKGKFAGGMNATQIKRQPDLFFVAWDMFKRQDNQIEEKYRLL